MAKARIKHAMTSLQADTLLRVAESRMAEINAVLDANGGYDADDRLSSLCVELTLLRDAVDALRLTYKI